ncbi:hypothetical protein M9Y10_022657 [Tritrichomonas musculus]|uniref:Uncharacterized protein n=1 Tax=Tritrichomonas musculus TaxID=1915356 RepID=A0ABR2KT44_9EUKA
MHVDTNDDEVVEIQKKKRDKVPKPQQGPACVYLEKHKKKEVKEVPKKQSRSGFASPKKLSTSPK